MDENHISNYINVCEKKSTFKTMVNDDFNIMKIKNILNKKYENFSVHLIKNKGSYFVNITKYGLFSWAQLFYLKNKKEISLYFIESSFQICCEKGYLDYAKWLNEITPELMNRNKYKVQEFLDRSFEKCCKNNQLMMAKWLYELNNSIKIMPNYLVITKTNHFNDFSDWLISINEDLIKNTLIETCRNGDFDNVKHFYEMKPNLDFLNISFNEICKSILHNSNKKEIYFGIAQWIYSINPNINISKESFLYVCKSGNFEIAEWLYSIKPNIVSYICDKFFSSLCHSFVRPNLFKTTQWVYSLNPTIKINYDTLYEICINNRTFEFIDYIFSIQPNLQELLSEDIFIRSFQYCEDERIFELFITMKPEFKDLINYELFEKVCKENNLKMVQWMILKNSNIILHINSDLLDSYFIEYSEEFDREYGPSTEFYRFNFEFMKFILSVKPDLHISNFIISELFHYGDLNDIKEFLSIKPELNVRVFTYISNEDNYIDRPDIMKYIMENINSNIVKEKCVKEVESCSICMDEKSNIITSCNHQFCKRCIIDWYCVEQNCPCCRNNLNYDHLYNIKNDIM